MALVDASLIAEQEVRFQSSHPDDVAELNMFCRYLADGFEKGLNGLQRKNSECSIVTQPQPHHYLIVPKRRGQQLGRIVRFIPGQDTEAVPLAFILQGPTDPLSSSDVRPDAKILPFKLPEATPETTTHRSYPTHVNINAPHRTQQSDRHKWYHPFGY